ncbi:MAG: hypothetical protein ABI369_15765 [Acetobacteraceae bacterium]
MNELSPFIGVGLYTPLDAARLAEVSVRRVRGWVQGYRHDGVPAVIERQLPDVDGEAGLTYRDLIEVRFIQHFLRAGVSWVHIRQAAREAHGELLEGVRHLRFRTDRTTILADRLAEDGDRVARELVSRQYVLLDVLRESFLEEFDLEGEDLLRAWHPRSGQPNVRVDPERAFGRPIVEPGIPTRTLADALMAEGDDAERVARLYGTTPGLVREAAAFELTLTA